MRIFAFAFLLAVTAIPPLYLDMYPFSVFPMFSDNRDMATVFEVFDPSGQQVNPLRYGLVDIKVANRDQRYGVVPPPYFKDYFDEVNASHLRQFLQHFYPHEAYPIRVRYFHRGFSAEARKVIVLDTPAEWDLDLADSDSEPQTP
jgi:hypothetical protein